MSKKSSAVYWTFVRDAEDLAQLVRSWGVISRRWIIKPSWMDEGPGIPTTAKVLDLVLSVLPGEKLVVESHTDRCYDPDSGISHSSLASLEQARRHRRLLSRWFARFLREQGIDKVLEKHDAQLVNVTEAVWEGAVADPQVVRKELARRGSRLINSSLYGYLPRRLYQLRGTPLVNLARFKGVAPRFRRRLGAKASPPSFSFKNLFGLEPTPLRLHYHAHGNDLLPLAIRDLNRLYSSLFPIYSIVEAIDSALLYDDQGEHRTPYGCYHLIPKPGFALTSTHIPTLDAFCYRLLGLDSSGDPYMEAAQIVYGPPDHQSLPSRPPISLSNRLRHPALLPSPGNP